MATTTIEKRLEANFSKWCRDQLIEPIKGPAQTARGFPDRFLQLPHGGGTIYVEFKGTSYYTLTPIQEWWRTYLMDSNANRYFLVETDEQLEMLKHKCKQLIEIGQRVVAFEKHELDLLDGKLEI